MVREGQAATEEKHHHAVEKPSLAWMANHPAEGVRQRGGQEDDGQHFQKVCKRRWVLIGMSPVRVEKATAIRAEIFDDFKRSYGALRNDLLRATDGSSDRIVIEIHGNALPDEQQRANQCSRQKNP